MKKLYFLLLVLIQFSINFPFQSNDLPPLISEPTEKELSNLRDLLAQKLFLQMRASFMNYKLLLKKKALNRKLTSYEMEDFVYLRNEYLRRNFLITVNTTEQEFYDFIRRDLDQANYETLRLIQRMLFSQRMPMRAQRKR